MDLNKYYGMDFINSVGMTERIQVRARRNKKKRIDKKWLLKYGFKSKIVPSNTIYVFDGKIFGHPKTIEKIKKEINKERERK